SCSGIPNGQAGSFSRHCLLFSGRSGTGARIFLRRKLFVKACAKRQQFFHDRFRKKSADTAMKAQTKRHPALQSQGIVVSWKTKFFETVPALEFGHATVALVAIYVTAIGEVRHSLLGRNFDSLGNHCIGRTFVEMLIL